MKLSYVDYRSEPAAWARKLGVSKEAVDLYLESDVIDPHTCSFLWERVLPRYRVERRHRPFLPNSLFFNQVDLPRAREAQLTGVSWDMTTNPFQFAWRRAYVAVRNIRDMVDTLGRFSDDYAVVRNFSEYERARAEGKTAGFISVQGGQSFDYKIEDLDLIPDDLVHRITVVHLTESRIGYPNSRPKLAEKPLKPFGRKFVQRMQEKRILVDLAHINRRGFFDALSCTDPSIPVVVTHTGIAGVRRIWRNVDDDQIHAVAERGGFIGIIYHPLYLDRARISCSLERVVDHMAYVVDTVGDDFVSLGSDYDGLIALPDELPDVTHQPRLVALMLARGWSDTRIKKILGGNFLRVLRQVRP